MKRIIRIISLYYIVTILSAGNSFESFIEKAKSLLFILIGGLPPDGLRPIYGDTRIRQGWTLNYEMYFYFVVAASMIFWRAKWLFTSTFITLMVVAPLFLFATPKNYGFIGFYFNFSYINLMNNPIVSEFVIGIFIFFYKNMSKKFSFMWEVIIVFSVLLFCINLYSPLYCILRIAACGIPSALLIIALLKTEKMTGYRYPGALLHIDNISFPIYFLHENIQKMLLKIIKHTSGNKNIYSDMTARFLLFSPSILFTLYISSLSNKYIEKGP